MKTETAVRSPKKVSITTGSRPTLDLAYVALLAGVRRSFASATENRELLFQTDATGLFDIWLAALPETEQQHYTCHTCKDFINHYGGLVSVGKNGTLLPVMWNMEAAASALGDHYEAVKVVCDRVRKARIVSPFVDKTDEWGKNATGVWHHLAVTAPPQYVFKSPLKSCGQRMAEWKEDFLTVKQALLDVAIQALPEAINLFATDSLAWGDKFIAPAKWLQALTQLPKGRVGENLLWKAIAEAPVGFKHPRSSVLWPLLEGIKAGDSYAVLKRKFGAMVDPLQYQRPQAAPTEGNIKAGEAIIEKLGLARSLERRFARLDDLNELTWSRQIENAVQNLMGGVFSHLKPKSTQAEVQQVRTPAQTMTWDKFMRTVLPIATELQLNVPSHGRFIALTTAVHADAPPIMKWDREDERNPVAWYVRHNGSYASEWGLGRGSWTAITAITPLPAMKYAPHIGSGYVLILDGCVDSADNSNALFPVCLRDDLHEIRATIEAYSSAATLGGREEANACGYDVRKEAADCHLRAMVDGRWQEIKIDRWD